MSIPDWRSKAAYDDLERVPMRGLAWEYLRRNEAYGRDYHDAGRVSDAERADASARRWGLRFPDRPVSIRNGDGAVLAANGVARRHHHPRTPRRSLRSSAGQSGTARSSP
ncbi:transcriptional regulator domain-containing protein [Pararhizobium mangrovi]|uniref:transcriptional regulator domain-containing protein n=1 Tax=Pararhizobium mangrovi TaxID=2590452 RepID=UPI002E263BE9